MYLRSAVGERSEDGLSPDRCRAGPGPRRAARNGDALYNTLCSAVNVSIITLSRFERLLRHPEGLSIVSPPKSTSPPPAAPGPARALGLSVRSARGSAGAGRSRSSQEYQCHRRDHSTHGSWSMDREVFMLGRRILPRRTPRHRRPLTTALTHAPRPFVTPSRCLVAQQDAARTEYVTCAVGEELDLVQVRGQVVRRLVLLPRLAAVFGAEDRAAAAHGPRRLAIG